MWAEKHRTTCPSSFNTHILFVHFIKKKFIFADVKQKSITTSPARDNSKGLTVQEVWVKEDYGKYMQIAWTAGACRSTTGASVSVLNNEAGNICRPEIQQTQPGCLPSSADNNNTSSSQNNKTRIRASPNPFRYGTYEFTQMLLPEMNHNYCCCNWTLDQSTVTNDYDSRLSFCLKQSFLEHTKISQQSSRVTLKATDNFNFEISTVD